MLLRSVLVLLACFAALNGLVCAGALRARVGVSPIDVQTRGIYELRLGQLAESGPPGVAVVGDSVVYGAHLAQSGGSTWPRLALPGQIEALLSKERASPVHVLNLGINGVLFDELHCVIRDVLDSQPELLFVNLSPRPFASDFTGDAPSVRPFLCDRSVERKVLTTLRRAIPVLKYRDAWQLDWLGTTPRALAQSTVSHWLSNPAPAQAVAGQDDDAHEGDADVDDEDEEDDAFVASMLWRFRAAQRLNSIEVKTDHPMAHHLRALLQTLTHHRRTRIVAFYLHEDEQALAGQLMAERFRVEQERFARMVRSGLQNADHVRFAEIPSSLVAGQYTDHVHLTAKGYAALAAHLVQVSTSIGAGRDAAD